MAKYEITHTCGHTETVQLFGKIKERKEKIEWMEAMPCVQCRLEGTEDLKGSDKQRAWAGEIRASKLSGLSADDAAILLEIKSASWWIDHRSQSGDELVKDLRHKRAVEERAQTVEDRDGLTGNVKEVKTAKAIRHNMIASVQLLVETALTGDDPEEVAAARKEVIEATTSWIDSHDTGWLLASRWEQYDGYTTIRHAAEAEAEKSN